MYAVVLLTATRDRIAPALSMFAGAAIVQAHNDVGSKGGPWVLLAASQDEAKAILTHDPVKQLQDQVAALQSQIAAGNGQVATSRK